jgi:perosamine synthetase
MSPSAKRNVPTFKLGMKPSDIDEVLGNIKEVLLSGQLTLGSNGKHFEEEFASFVGMPFACSVSSGTAALEIALRIFGVRGKQVLVPSNTFFATAAAVIHAGGIPRFVDCDPRTLDIDYESMVKRYTPQCAGVIVVHIGGPVAPCIDAVQRFCRERGLFLLEDAAHAHGSTLNGKQAGSFGDAAAFSFYPTKVMTSGEGGMLVTGSEKFYKEVLIYRDQGKEGFYSNFHIRLGHNWRMSELHAALGRSQLKRLPANLARRRQIAKWYGSALQGLTAVKLQSLSADSESNYYKYPVLLPKKVDRTKLRQRLKEEWGVSLSGEVYTLPCHKQPIFEKYVDGSFPGADDACARHICLPLYPDLSHAEAEYVVDALKTTISSLMKEVSH